MTSGVQRRLERILGDKTSKLIVPIDHAFSLGPINGLGCREQIKNWVSSNKISAILAHRGTINFLNESSQLSPGVGTILHLNGSPVLDEAPYLKEVVCDIDCAYQLACDAVSLDLNFLRSLVTSNFRLLGSVIDRAYALQLPVLVMLSERATEITDADFIRNMRLYIRSTIELGADIIKISIPSGKPDSFYEDLLDGLTRDAKIVVAGGEKMKKATFLEFLDSLLTLGVSGLCIGRNIFQSTEPLELISDLSRLTLRSTQYDHALA